MSEDVAGRLITELAAVGGSAELGEFSIDEDAARRKLADHRLADPHGWLCQVIEAANLLGATTIALTLRLGDLSVEFDGEGFELDDLFGAMFAAASEAPEQGRRNRARRKLALGIDALLATPKLESVEIVNLAGRLYLQPDGTREFDASGQASASRIHVRRGFHGWPELEQVRERCRYFPHPITIEGEPVAFGLRQALDDEGVGEDRWPIVDEGVTIGWYGWQQGVASASMLVLLCDGVAVEGIVLGGEGEIAILDAPFRRDIGEAKIVRDAEFERLLALVEALRREHPRPLAREPEAERVPTPATSKPTRVRAAMLLTAFWMLVFPAVGGVLEFSSALVFGLMLAPAAGFGIFVALRGRRPR